MMIISKLRRDNQGIGDLHVSGSIVSANALKAEALNEQFNSIQKKGVYHCHIFLWRNGQVANFNQWCIRSTKQAKSI